jgi:hypothetical protein
MPWSFDMSKAPRGHYVVKSRSNGKTSSDTRVFVPENVIIGTAQGEVLKSWYLPDEKRWCGCSLKTEVVCWMAWPEHPNAQRADKGANITMKHEAIQEVRV